MSYAIVDDSASGSQDKVLAHNIALGIIEYVSSLVPGIEDLAGKWTLIRQTFLLCVVDDGDGFVVHEEFLAFCQIVKSVETCRK